MLIRNFIRIIQNGWRWVLMFTLLGLMLSLLVSLSTVPQYRSTASFLIFPNPSLASSRDVVTSLNTLGTESVSKTYLEIFNSKRVFQDTVDKLGLDPAVMDEYSVDAVVTTGSNINLTITGPDPRMAAFLANNIGQNGINYIKSIYQVFDISFLDQAAEPTVPSVPQTLPNALAGALVGFFVGIIVVLVRESARAPLQALRMRAVTDKLSGAFLQRHFISVLEQEIIRKPGGSLSLGIIDLEGIEEIYDILPESVLADLLPKVTTILRNQLRGNDVIGRWNKTSFAVLMPSTPREGAGKTMERIKRELVVPIRIQATNEEIKLDPCIGWTSRANDDTADTLQQNALKALDIARTSGEKIAEVPQPA